MKKYITVIQVVTKMQGLKIFVVKQNVKFKLDTWGPHFRFYR